MPLRLALQDYTLRTLLEDLSDETLVRLGQITQAIQGVYGLTLSFAPAIGSDVTDRLGRLVGVVRSEWANHLRNDRAFQFQTSQTGAAGQVGTVQLFNPAASAVDVLVFGAWGRLSVAGNLDVGFDGVAAATFVLNGRNLRAGGAASVAEIRRSSTVVEPGTLFTTHRADGTSVYAAGGGKDTESGLVCILPPGQGLDFTTNNVAVETWALFRWAEVLR